MNYDRPELLDRLAAEYVLGTMTGPVRRRFRSIQRIVPRAAEAVATWERRLHGLATSVPPVQPAPGTWRAIERRIGAAPRAEGSSRWRAWLAPLAGVALGVVATLGIVELRPELLVPFDRIVQERGVLPQSYVGLLTNPAGDPVLLASATRHGRILSLKVLRKIDVPPGKVLQLWALPDKGAPFPLAVVPAQGKAVAEMADTSEKLLSAVPRLAVSLEDRPAAPGAQHAPFVLTGNCVKLW